MQKRRVGKHAAWLVLATVWIVAGGGAASAVTSSSPHYQLNESEFNSGGTVESCSGQYCARVAIGSNAVGGGETAASTASFGPITGDEPVLEVIVDPGQSNLGVLDTQHTSSKTMVVRIRSYLSNGYILQINGRSPTYGTHSLATPSTPTAATPGVEQFAINAAANTSPQIGAAAVQVPSSDFSFGTVASDYSTPNLFKYQSGDTVAHSTSQSGRTDFTISMIVNVANNTPAGLYSGEFSAVVIPVF